MDWKQRTIIRILLFVASMLSDNEQTTGELKALSNHINFAGAGKEA